MARTISQSLYSLESSASSLKGTRDDIRTAIQNKGVTVPSGTALSGMPGYIGNIKTASSAPAPTYSIELRNPDNVSVTLRKGSSDIGTYSRTQTIYGLDPGYYSIKYGDVIGVLNSISSTFPVGNAEVQVMPHVFIVIPTSEIKSCKLNNVTMKTLVSGRIFYGTTYDQGYHMITETYTNGYTYNFKVRTINDACVNILFLNGGKSSMYTFSRKTNEAVYNNDSYLEFEY